MELFSSCEQDHDQPSRKPRHETIQLIRSPMETHNPTNCWCNLTNKDSVTSSKLSTAFNALSKTLQIVVPRKRYQKFDGQFVTRAVSVRNELFAVTEKPDQDSITPNPIELSNHALAPNTSPERISHDRMANHRVSCEITSSNYVMPRGCYPADECGNSRWVCSSRLLRSHTWSQQSAFH